MEEHGIWGGGWSPGQPNGDLVDDTPMGNTPGERVAGVVEAIMQGRSGHVRSVLLAWPMLLKPTVRRRQVLEALAHTPHPHVGRAVVDALDAASKATPIGVADITVLMDIMADRSGVGANIQADVDALGRDLAAVMGHLDVPGRLDLAEAQDVFVHALATGPVGLTSSVAAVMGPKFSVAQLLEQLLEPRGRHTELVENGHGRCHVVTQMIACCSSNPELARTWCTQIWGAIPKEVRGRLLVASMSWWEYGIDKNVLLGIDSFSRINEDTRDDMERAIGHVRVGDPIHLSGVARRALFDTNLTDIPGIEIAPLDRQPGCHWVGMSPGNLINFLAAHHKTLDALLSIDGSGQAVNAAVSDAALMMFALHANNIGDDPPLLRRLLRGVPRLATWTDPNGNTVGHWAAAHMADLWTRAESMRVSRPDPTLTKRAQEIKHFYQIAEELAPEWLEARNAAGQGVDVILAPVWKDESMQAWLTKKQERALKTEVAPAARRRVGAFKRM